jgi:two-component system sensor histidine kinase KdpD
MFWYLLAPSATVLFFPAVMVAATYGGLGPGLTATFLSAASIAYFFMPPYWSFKVTAADFVRLVAFVGATFLITSVANARRRAEEAQRRALNRSGELYRALQESFARESQAEATRQSERLKAALLDALTHNLRTPLTAMKAAVTALRDDHLTVEPETRSELLEVIDEEVDRLNRFVAGLGTPVGSSRIRAVPATDLLQAARKKADALTRDHRLTVAVDRGLPTVEVDWPSAVEALYMVLDNAAKYSPPGTVIEMTATRYDEHHVRVTITDEGPGIPPELRERVFERFFRIAASADTLPGSGLGLSIAQQLVAAQGGRIWIEDAPAGRGVSVVMTLPTDVDLNQIDE